MSLEYISTPEIITIDQVACKCCDETQAAELVKHLSAAGIKRVARLFHLYYMLLILLK